MAEEREEIERRVADLGYISSRGPDTSADTGAS